MNLKGQLLRPSLTDVFTSIFSLHALKNQLTTLALGLCVDCLGRSQQLTILVPFHLSLSINYFTA